MGELRLNYGEILDAQRGAALGASLYGAYGEAIERKVTRKISGIKLGESGYTNAAVFWALEKKKRLEEKEARYKNYASSLHDFVHDENGAIETDKAVAGLLNQSYSQYIDSHNIKVNPVVETMTALSVWVGNNGTERMQNSLLGKILAGGYDFIEDCRGIGEKLEYWYRCEGGKNIIKIACVAIIAVAAVVAAVVALPAVLGSLTALAAAFSLGALWTFTVATASFVGALISAVNSITDLVYECRAFGNVRKGKAAEGQMQSNTDSLSDAFRNTIFEGKLGNQISMAFADGWDTVETVCGVIAFTDLAKNGIKYMKDHRTISKGWDNAKKTAASIKTKWDTVKAGGLKTLKTDMVTKAKAGLHQLTSTEGLKKLGKDAWSTIKSFGEKIDAINDATENKTIKNYSETTDWIDGMNKEAWLKDSLKNIVKFNNHLEKTEIKIGDIKLGKPIDIAEKIANYGSTYIDKGFDGVREKAKENLIDKIDILDKASEW